MGRPSPDSAPLFCLIDVLVVTFVLVREIVSSQHTVVLENCATSFV